MEISINGEQYGLLWGIAAIDRFCNVVDMELEDALNLIFKDTTGNPREALTQTVALSKFTACAIYSYAKVRSQSCQISSEQVLEEFDNQGVELITGILNDFMSSKILGQNVSDFLGVTVAETKTKKKRSPSVK